MAVGFTIKNGVLVQYEEEPGVTEVVIPSGVTSIGQEAFYNCSSLTLVMIPDGVTSIGDWTFDGCSSLTSVTISDSITSIGNGIFNGCDSLTAIIYNGTQDSFEKMLWPDKEKYRSVVQFTSAP